jgi:hypothetical protein
MVTVRCGANEQKLKYANNVDAKAKYWEVFQLINAYYDTRNGAQ